MGPDEAMEIAEGQESRRGDVYAAMGVFFPVAFIAVSLRFYSRIKFSYVGIDDVLILLAFVRHIAPATASTIGSNMVGTDIISLDRLCWSDSSS